MRRSNHNLNAIACALFAVLSCRTALATILPFEMTPFPGFIASGYETTFASYGDNVTATTAPGPGGRTYLYAMGNAFTPNIALSYSHVDNAPAGSTGHSPYPTEGGWSDPPDYLHFQSEDVFWYTFTPSNAFGVDVNSFSIDLYSGSGITLNWKLRQGSTGGPIFASGTETALTSVGADRIVNIPDSLFYGTVVLEIDFSSGATGAMGIDDLNFDQVPPVPEPATGLLVLVGLGLAEMKRYRRRRVTRG